MTLSVLLLSALSLDVTPAPSMQKLENSGGIIILNPKKPKNSGGIIILNPKKPK
ncbi:hypothetical protein [Pseudoalteromonas sp. S558]|uniref:hypothetical protein n=1 Tax=Pseudoalteromonas sp. S558 TaxID=2066515 RepID=UPI0014870DF7|nr:hypothetical protein [Pseudoalteromonas sp. S558]